MQFLYDNYWIEVLLHRMMAIREESVPKNLFPKYEKFRCQRFEK